MEYRRFENTVIVRMDRNEDLFAELKKVALKENIKLASISALGTFSHMNVGVYDLDQRKFVGNDFDGMFEIVSLTGTINTMDGEYYCHLHTAAGDKNGNVYGGHLSAGTVGDSLAGKHQIGISAQTWNHPPATNRTGTEQDRSGKRTERRAG